MILYFASLDEPLVSFCLTHQFVLFRYILVAVKSNPFLYLFECSPTHNLIKLLSAILRSDYQKPTVEIL